MDAIEEIFFLLYLSVAEVESYLDRTYGQEYFSGLCEYWGFETDEELKVLQAPFKQREETVPHELVGRGVPMRVGMCALTGMQGMCRVITRMG